MKHCTECGRVFRLCYSIDDEFQRRHSAPSQGMCIECWLMRLEHSGVENVSGAIRSVKISGANLKGVVFDHGARTSPGEGGIVTINGETFELVPWVQCRNNEHGRQCPARATHLVSGGRLVEHPVCEAHARAIEDAAHCGRTIVVEPI